MNWLDLILLVILALPPIGLFAARNWIKAWIENAVRHNFDEKIESLRSELHRQEEALRIDLRSKEAAIEALRNGVLGGRAQRQALLDKRRLEAVDALWAAVIALAPYKAVAASMAVINFSAAARRTPNEPKLREFFAIMTKNAPNPKSADPAKNKQPFVSTPAWAYFSAYQAVVYIAYAQAKVLESGIENPGTLLDMQNARNMLKTALPNHAEYIDQQGAIYPLLDELEASLLAELKNTLEGAEIDETNVKKSAAIIAQVDEIKITREREEQRAKANAAGIEAP